MSYCYCLGKCYTDTNWEKLYFDPKDQTFNSYESGKFSIFRDLEDVEAFKKVMEFYGHNGLTVIEINIEELTDKLSEAWRKL